MLLNNTARKHSCHFSLVMLTSSADCQPRSYARSCPTWMLLHFLRSVSPISSSISSPTRSEYRPGLAWLTHIARWIRIWLKVTTVSHLSHPFLLRSMQCPVDQDIHGRVWQESKAETGAHGWADADGSHSGGAGSAGGLLEVALLQGRGCTWHKQVEKASSSHQQIHWAAQSNGACLTVRAGGRPGSSSVILVSCSIDFMLLPKHLSWFDSGLYLTQAPRPRVFRGILWSDYNWITLTLKISVNSSWIH